MLKIDLHTHTLDDPKDAIPHTAEELIDRAAALGYQGLAITLHDRQLDAPALSEYARARGVVLIPGTERTIEGKHVLLLNFPAAATEVGTFEQLYRLKAAAPGLIVAPHAFYPTRSSLNGLLTRHAELFDAVEINYCYTAALNFNRRAIAWAAAHGRPLVGNSDTHRLFQLGRTFSLVQADPRPDAICAAIRAGRVEVRTEPLSFAGAARLMTSLWLADLGLTGRTPQPQTAT